MVSTFVLLVQVAAFIATFMLLQRVLAPALLHLHKNYPTLAFLSATAALGFVVIAVSELPSLLAPPVLSSGHVLVGLAFALVSALTCSVVLLTLKQSLRELLTGKPSA